MIDKDYRKTTTHPFNCILCQNNECVVLVVARKKISGVQSTAIPACRDETDGPVAGPQSHPGLKLSHTRSKSAPSSRPGQSRAGGDNNEVAAEEQQEEQEEETDGPRHHSSQETIRNGHNGNHLGSSDSVINEHFYDLPEGEDYMAIYETIDRKRSEAAELKGRSASMEELETPNASLKSFNMNSDSVSAGCKAEPQIPRDRKRHRSKSGSKSEQRKAAAAAAAEAAGSVANSAPATYDPVGEGMAQFLKKALRIEGPQLSQKTVTIRKTARESLGMRIGGGIGSNEGDTPIYIANIHPHGCIGKSKQMKVRKRTCRAR